MPYRTAPSSVVPRSYAELFAPAVPLFATDDLELDYEVLPWKRIVVSLRWRPPAVSRLIERLMLRFELALKVVHSSELDSGRYSVSVGQRALRFRETVDADGASRTSPFETLDRPGLIEMRAGRSAFVVEDGVCSFRASGYDPAELPLRFESAHGQVLVDLPPLLGREWQAKRV